MRGEVFDWNEEPDDEELAVESVLTPSGVLIDLDTLEVEEPVVGVMELVVLETNGLTDVLMELIGKVEIEIPVLRPVATLAEEDRLLLGRTDEEG